MRRFLPYAFSTAAFTTFNITGVMSMPIPSPSMNATIGLSGTFSDASGLMVMRWPSLGTLMCSYCMRGVQQLPCRTVLADQHREFERLFVVEAGVDGGLVCTRKVRIRQAARTAGAFGDVFTGQLDVHA